MISSALLNIVAESIVILLPICHVGCFRASASVAFSTCSRVALRNGPPDAVRITRGTSLARPPALHGLKDGQMLRIDREKRNTQPSRLRNQQRAGNDQRFLVRQCQG